MALLLCIGRQVPSFEKTENLDHILLRTLTVEEMRKLHAHVETNPDAAAAAIEVAALGKWQNIKKGGYKKQIGLKRTALARVFMELNVGSHSNANLEALFNDAEGPPDGEPPTADTRDDGSDDAAAPAAPAAAAAKAPAAAADAPPPAGSTPPPPQPQPAAAARMVPPPPPTPPPPGSGIVSAGSVDL